MVRIGNDWDAVLADEFKKDYYLKTLYKEEMLNISIMMFMSCLIDTIMFVSYENI